MPYENEFAAQITAQDAIHKNYPNLKFFPKRKNYSKLDSVFVNKGIKNSKIKRAIVLDGSKFDAEVDAQYSSQMALININQCLIDLEKIEEFRKKKFPSQKEYLEIYSHHKVQCVLPIEGISRSDEEEDKDFFRFSLLEILKNMENPLVKHIPGVIETETLYETYMTLVKKTDAANFKNAKTQPCRECERVSKKLDFRNFQSMGKWRNVSECRCPTNPKEVYITDFLGFHTLLNSETSNEALTTQIMLVMEKLVLMNLINTLYKNKLYDYIDETAIILDGSLSVYSHSQWLSYGISRHLNDLQEDKYLMLFSVEKTGAFIDHIEKVHKYFKEPPKNGALWLFQDDYIKKFITDPGIDEYYGENTHFGKKAYYRSLNGQDYIINIVFKDEEDRAVMYPCRNNIEYIGNMYALQDILWVFDNFPSNSFKNALSLLSFAHEGAALSTSYTGRTLLNSFLKDFIGSPNESTNT